MALFRLFRCSTVVTNNHRQVFPALSAAAFSFPQISSVHKPLTFTQGFHSSPSAFAGHSKWANIKHRKGRQDEAKMKVFSKIVRQVITAARVGGGNVPENHALIAAVAAARAVNLPKDKIQTAIDKVWIYWQDISLTLKESTVTTLKLIFDM